MTGPRRAILIGVPVCAAAAAAAGMLGVASGEGPTGTATPRTISVQGVGTVPIGARDDAATATATYREGAAKALADAQAKASFLAGRAGVTITAVQSLAEDGGYIECSSPTSEYASYEGQQPDFGFASAPSVIAGAGAAAPSAGLKASPQVSHRPRVKHKKHPAAKKAAATSCNLTAQVSVVYALG
jgi:hypothetical protein